MVGGLTLWTLSCLLSTRTEALLTCLVSDELLLPHMKRVDGMITDNRKRLLHKLHIGQVLKVGVSCELLLNVIRSSVINCLVLCCRTSFVR